MRAFNFTLLAVLGYVAVIGATPLGARAPAEAVDRRQLYVVLTTASGEVLTRLKNLSPACPAILFLSNHTARHAVLQTLKPRSVQTSAVETPSCRSAGP
jgi:hypothetical protein